MITVTILWRDGGKSDVSAPTHGQAMDKADAMGARCIRDSLGGRLIKISGEWVYIN
jgi:hypothetical protein